MPARLIKEIVSRWKRKREESKFNRAIGVIKGYGLSIVRLETVAGTNYLVDLTTSQRYRVGANRKGRQ